MKKKTKQWTIMKKKGKTMKTYEKERNKNEKSWKIEKKQWKMMNKRETTMKNDEK
jgi:hypothetical protein